MLLIYKEEKTMKKLITLGVGGALLFSGIAMADGIFGDTDPYIGLEYKHQWMNGKNDWKDFVADKFHNGGVFFGIKFHENWGLELGHNQSTKRSAENTYSANQSIFVDRTVSAGDVAKTKVRIKNTYLDLNGFWAMSDNWDFLGTLGIGFTKAKIQDNGSTGTQGANTFLTEIRNANAKTKAIARVGIGAEYKCNHWKFRGKLLWENTNRLRVKDVLDTTPTKYYKDSIGVGLGVSYYFFD